MTFGAIVGRAVYELALDDRGLNKGLDRTERSSGERMKRIGKTMSVAVTAPILGIAAAVWKATEDIDSAFATIRSGTGETGEVLKGLEDDFKSLHGSVRASSQEIAAAVAIVNTRLGLTGEALQKVARAALESGADLDVFIKGMAVFDVRAEDVAAKLDGMFVATQAAGISFNTLGAQVQTFGPVMKNAGFTIDETVAFFANLEKSGVDLTRVMPGLNAHIRRLAEGGVTDLKGALLGTVREMEAAKTTSDKLRIATAAFGAEGAQRMVIAVDNGAFALGELVDVMRTAEGAIDRNAEATRTNTERLAMMRQEISERLAGAWSALPLPMQFVTAGLGGVLAAIGPLLIALPALTTMVNLNKLAFLSHPFFIVIAAIIALVVAGYLLIKHWDVVKRKAEEIWDSIQWYFDKVLGEIRAIFALSWDDIAAKLERVWETIKEKAADAFEWLKQQVGPWLEAIWDALVEAVESVDWWGLIKDLAQRYAEALYWWWLEFLPRLYIKLSKLLMQGLQKALEWTWQAIKDSAAWTWQAIKDSAAWIWNEMKSNAEWYWNAIKDSLEWIWNAIKDSAAWTWQAIKDSLEWTFNAIKDSAEWTWNAIKDSAVWTWGEIKDNLEWTWNAIKDTAEWIWGEIKDNLEWTWNAIKDTAEVIWNAIKDFLGVVWTEIKDAAAPAWQAIADVASLAWQAIADAAGAALGFVLSLINSIMRRVDAVMTRVSRLRGEAQDAIDFAEGAADKIPGVGIIKNIIKNIPFLAEGGIVHSPTVAMIAEEKPEVVVPLDRLDQLSRDGPRGGGLSVAIYGDVNGVDDLEERLESINQRLERRGSTVAGASGA